MKISSVGVFALVVFLTTQATQATQAQDRGGEWKRLIDQVGALYQAGRYDDAVVAAKKAIEIAEQQYDSDSPEVARSLNDLAFLYRSRGNFSEAESLYLRALSLYEKGLGADHLYVAQILSNLAELYGSQRRFSEAEPLLKRALAVFKKTLGPDHSAVAACLNSLAGLYYAQGDYAEAEPLYKRSLAINEKVLGPENPAVAMSLNNLATVFNNQGRYTESEPLLKRALAICEKTYGPDHPDVATSLNNLAWLYHRQGNYVDAEPLLERALAIRKTTFGPDHPSVAESQNNLAQLYGDQGRYDEAEPLYERSTAVWEKVLGPEHPSVATGLNNLALLYCKEGRYAEAEPLYKRSLAIREKALGPEHPVVAQTIENLATLYRTTDRTEEAEVLEQRLAPSRTASGDVVGSIGNLNKIEILGAEAFSPAVIRKALRSNPELLVLSHPMVHRDAFMDGLVRLTTLGYMQAGFVDANVSAGMSDAGDHPVLTIDEGMRFRNGKVVVSGLTSITENALVDWLTKPDPDIAIAPGEPFDPKNPDGDKPGLAMRSWSGKTSDDTKRPAPVWELGKPAKCTDTQIDAIKKSLGMLFAEHGLFFPQMEVSPQFDHSSEQAELHIALLNEGPRGMIGNIEVEGLINHSRGEILEYIDLKEGQALNRDMLLAAEQRLVDSGRFVSVKLEPDPPAKKGDKLTLGIHLQEVRDVPGLATPLSEVEKACLSFGEWVRGLSEGGEDIRVRFSFDETNVVTIASSVSNGVAVVVSDAGFEELTGTHVRGGLLLGSGRAELLQAPDQQSLWTDARSTEFELKMTLLPPGLGPEQKGYFGAGCGFHSDDAVEGAIRLKVDMPPCAFLYLADMTNAEARIEGSLLTINLDNIGLELEFDCQARRLKPLRLKHPEQDYSIQLEVGPGLFDQTCRAATQCSNGKRSHLSGMVFIGAVTARMLELVADMPEMGGEFAQPMERTADILSVFADAGKALPSREETRGKDDKFEIPLKPEYAQNPLLWAMALCYGHLSEMLPEDSWPVVVSREAAMMSAGQPNFLYGSLRTLIAEDNMGPVGCLMLSELSEYIGPMAAGEFANKGLALLSEDDFMKDVDLVVQALDSHGVLDPANGYLDAVDWGRLAEAVAETAPDDEARNKCLQEIRAIQEVPANERLNRLGLALWRGWHLEQDLKRDLSRTVAQSLSSQASLYTSQGRYVEAEPLYQRSLDILEEALGPDHPEVAQYLDNLAGLYRETGREQEAEPLEERAARIRNAQAESD